ncbi:hypothetical protein SAMN05216327_10326 [Dyadobacter sp. SG02]|uniref:hypothetical protein n=1 Tax=Dyadobacter sp. SG02 TaxID=1855291 RepID=UPI0008AFB583|nr:hypothetical protein [Dyadobacter sp. SG02]SEI64606.1 hypothetical protein SAMN05216327_10326 [Dyadobacter sp. SG02]
MKIFLIAMLGAGIVFQTLPETTATYNNVKAATADTTKKDPETGLIVDENLYMVKAQCTNCHSTKLISANRFTRDGWKQKIRWMQANHNLWELGDAEKPVLDYLEKNYSPTASVARRAPLKDIKWYKLDQN